MACIAKIKPKSSNDQTRVLAQKPFNHLNQSFTRTYFHFGGVSSASSRLATCHLLCLPDKDLLLLLLGTVLVPGFLGKLKPGMKNANITGSNTIWYNYLPFCISRHRFYILTSATHISSSCYNWHRANKYLWSNTNPLEEEFIPLTIQLHIWKKQSLSQV